MYIIRKLLKLGLLTNSEADFAQTLVERGLLNDNPSTDEVLSSVI